MKKWECTVCGYIHEGEEPPDECPLCSADKSMFVELIEEKTVPNLDETKKELSVHSYSRWHKIYTLASDLILKYHFHSIMVHSPNGILPMSLIFLLIALFCNRPPFESAAFYSLVFTLLSMPLVLFTGYVTWQRRYRNALTPIFKIKIGASVVSVALLFALIIWRTVQPDIITTASNGRWVFLFLSFLLVGAVSLAGHMGGKLIFGGRKEV